MKAARACALQSAKRIPRAAPAKESNRLSVRSCWIILPLPAPRARRTAISFSRGGARQEQRRKVGTDNDQDDCDCGGQDINRLVIVLTDSNQPFLRGQKRHLGILCLLKDRICPM